MKSIARVGDTFSGTINVNGEIVNINGTFISSAQSSTKADGKAVIVVGSKGEYMCPKCNSKHTVTAGSLSNQGGVSGKKVTRVGDPCTTDVHDTVDIKATSGSGSSKSS